MEANRFECLGESFTGSQKQVAVDVPSACAENHNPSGTNGKKTGTDKSRRSLPARTPTWTTQVSGKEPQNARSSCGAALNMAECAPKEAINISPRVEEPAQLTTAPDKELKMQDPMNKWPSDSTELGGRTHAPPPVEPVPSHEPNEEEEQTEGEEAEDEDLIAPVELKIEFLRAVMDKDLELAHRLCQMILIHEPDNPEASGFLPLIKKKLLEEQEAEQSNEEEDDEEDSDDDDDDDDDDNSSGSDEESSQSSSCSSSSCSSSSPSDDDGEKEERQVNRHKPCPPSHISP